VPLTWSFLRSYLPVREPAPTLLNVGHEPLALRSMRPRSRVDRRAGLHPQRADRRREDPLAERICALSSVKNHSSAEPVTELISEPGQVTRGFTVGSSLSLHLDSHNLTPSELTEEVDFVAALLGPEVVQAGTCGGERELGSDLCRDERVEESPQKVSVAQDSIDVEAQDACEERGIDEVTLRGQDQTPAPFSTHVPQASLPFSRRFLSPTGSLQHGPAESWAPPLPSLNSERLAGYGRRETGSRTDQSGPRR
jgi:hypothetical protein